MVLWHGSLLHHGFPSPNRSWWSLTAQSTAQSSRERAARLSGTTGSAGRATALRVGPPIASVRSITFRTWYGSESSTLCNLQCFCKNNKGGAWFEIWLMLQRLHGTVVAFTNLLRERKGDQSQQWINDGANFTLASPGQPGFECDTKMPGPTSDNDGGCYEDQSYDFAQQVIVTQLGRWTY